MSKIVGDILHIPILHLWILQESTEPIQSFWKIHGKAGVTDVCYHDNYVYTSGRDGYFRQYSVENDELHLLNANRVSFTPLR